MKTRIIGRVLSTFGGSTAAGHLHKYPAGDFLTSFAAHILHSGRSTPSAAPSMAPTCYATARFQRLKTISGKWGGFVSSYIGCIRVLR
jgi:hypothetical protein